MECEFKVYMGCFPKMKSTFFWVGVFVSHNQDYSYSILGSILGSPYFGKLPYGLSKLWGLGLRFRGCEAHPNAPLLLKAWSLCLIKHAEVEEGTMPEAIHAKSKSELSAKNPCTP